MSALVIAAHPDDEVLGAGATIAMLASQNCLVEVLILAEGVSLRRGWSLESARARCRRAADVLGASSVTFGGLGQYGLMADGESRAVVALVESALEATAPHLVLTHHSGDIHSDHRVVSESVTYATRLPGRGRIREVWHFEVPSSTEQQTSDCRAFRPSVYIDAAPYIEVKCKALEIYADECLAPPHPRSAHGIRVTAAWRGLQAGLAFAEGFEQSRRLITTEYMPMAGTWS